MRDKRDETRGTGPAPCLAPLPVPERAGRVRSAGCLNGRVLRPSPPRVGEQQESHDVDDLDHRVDRGTGGILVGIADRIAGDRGMVASDPLPPRLPSSMYFLALSQAPPPDVIDSATNSPVTIVPSSMAPSEANAATRPIDGPDHDIENDRRQDGQQRRNDHLANRRTGEQVDGHGCSPGLPVPSMMPAISRNWRPHLLDDGPGSPAHGLHRQGAKQIGQQTAHEEPDHDIGVGKAERDVKIREVVRKVLDIGGEQHERGETGPSRWRSPW